MTIPVYMWIRHAYALKVKGDHITNNMIESFNQWIDDLRNKIILSLLEVSRVKLINKIHKSMKKVVIGNIMRHQKLEKKISRFCSLMAVGQNNF